MMDLEILENNQSFWFISLILNGIWCH